MRNHFVQLGPSRGKRISLRPSAFSALKAFCSWVPTDFPGNPPPETIHPPPAYGEPHRSAIAWLRDLPRGERSPCRLRVSLVSLDWLQLLHAPAEAVPGPVVAAVVAAGEAVVAAGAPTVRPEPSASSRRASRPSRSPSSAERWSSSRTDREYFIPWISTIQSIPVSTTFPPTRPAPTVALSPMQGHSRSIARSTPG